MAGVVSAAETGRRKGAKPSLPSADGPRAGRNLSAGKRAELLANFSALDNDSRHRKIGTGGLEAEAGVAQGYIRKHLMPKARAGSDAGLADSPRCGRPPVMTPAFGDELTGIAERLDWEVTYREIAHEMHERYGHPFCFKTYFNWMHSTGWNVHCSKDIKPMLTPKNRASRREFAVRHKSNKWDCWVDVDEKWFYTVKLPGKKKVPPGVEIPPERVKHKSHIPKLMVLSAVGRPRDDNDGKIGTWRVSGQRVAQRNSKNHERGEEYEDDITMTAKLYHKMMTEEVFPAIRLAYADEAKVFVQQDGASPHTGKNMLERLNRVGAAYKTGPKLEVVQQPPNSPDMNTCDLGFFRGLSTDVHKIRRGQKRSVFDKDKLAHDIAAAFRAYPREALEQTWDYKEHIMAKVIAADGDNVYDKRRRSTPGRVTRAPAPKRPRHDRR
jgi:hypothetical protein